MSLGRQPSIRKKKKKIEKVPLEIYWKELLDFYNCILKKKDLTAAKKAFESEFKSFRVI